MANGLAAAIAGEDLDPASAGAALRAITQQSMTGGILLLLMGLVLAVMLVVLLLTYIVRVALTVLLVAGAPLALMFHALPHTEGIAKWWWKAFAAVLAIQVGQSLALITALKVFLAPGMFTPFGTATDNGLINILVAIAMVYVLVKIPFWMLSTIGGGGGGSLVGSLVRSVVAYKTFGLLGGGRRGGRGRAARAARPGRGGSDHGESDDPYARVRATRDGQYMLPLAGLTRKPRPAPGVPMPPTPRRPRTDQGQQLVLPLGDDWPENKPILGRDGQYRLPLDVKRQPRPAPAPTPPPRSGRPRRTGPQPVQTKLDLASTASVLLRPASTRSSTGASAGTWLDAAGQFALPLDIRRVPPPPPPPVPPAPARPAATGPRPRQLHLPLDLPVRRRSPAAKPPPPVPPAASPHARPAVSPAVLPARPRRRPGKGQS